MIAIYASPEWKTETTWLQETWDQKTSGAMFVCYASHARGGSEGQVGVRRFMGQSSSDSARLQAIFQFLGVTDRGDPGGGGTDPPTVTNFWGELGRAETGGTSGGAYPFNLAKQIVEWVREDPAGLNLLVPIDVQAPGFQDGQIGPLGIPEPAAGERAGVALYQENRTPGLDAGPLPHYRAGVFEVTTDGGACTFTLGQDAKQVGQTFGGNISKPAGPFTFQFEGTAPSVYIDLRFSGVSGGQITHFDVQ